jgi:hypothetical protein
MANRGRTSVGVAVRIPCRKMYVVQISDDLQEVVILGANSRVKRFPKTLSPAYPEQDLQ